MPLSEVARCWRCRTLKNGAELRLNRLNWEYECAEGCEVRITSTLPRVGRVDIHAAKVKRKRKAKPGGM